MAYQTLLHAVCRLHPPTHKLSLPHTIYFPLIEISRYSIAQTLNERILRRIASSPFIPFKDFHRHQSHCSDPFDLFVTQLYPLHLTLKEMSDSKQPFWRVSLTTFSVFASPSATNTLDHLSCTILLTVADYISTELSDLFPFRYIRYIDSIRFGCVHKTTYKTPITLANSTNSPAKIPAT